MYNIMAPVDITKMQIINRKIVLSQKGNCDILMLRLSGSAAGQHEK